jgi:hypothetical protein
VNKVENEDAQGVQAAGLLHNPAFDLAADQSAGLSRGFMPRI